MVEFDLARKNMGREWDMLADEIKRMLLVFHDIAGTADCTEMRELAEKEFAREDD